LTVITLPQSFDIPIGQEFYATKQDSGAIVLTPQVEDYFTSDKYNFRQSESYRPEGKNGVVRLPPCQIKQNKSQAKLPGFYYVIKDDDYFAWP